MGVTADCCWSELSPAVTTTTVTSGEYPASENLQCPTRNCCLKTMVVIQHISRLTWITPRTGRNTTLLSTRADAQPSFHSSAPSCYRSVYTRLTCSGQTPCGSSPGWLMTLIALLMRIIG